MAGYHPYKLRKSLGNQLCRLRVLAFEEKRMAAYDGNINTQSREEVAELAGDIASTDDDQAAGKL